MANTKRQMPKRDGENNSAVPLLFTRYLKSKVCTHYRYGLKSLISSCYNGQVPSQPTGCFVWCAAQRGIHDQLPLHLSPAGNSLSVSLIITCSYHSLILSKNIIGISYPIKNTASLTTCNQSG